MRRTVYRCVLAIAFGTISAQGRDLAESEKHFEGPYRITTSAPRKIRASVKAVHRYPNLVATEWLVVYALPPKFAGQPSAMGRIQVARMSLLQSPAEFWTKALFGSRWQPCTGHPRAPWRAEFYRSGDLRRDNRPPQLAARRSVGPGPSAYPLGAICIPRRPPTILISRAVNFRRGCAKRT